LDTWDGVAVLEGNSTPTLVLTVLFSLALFKSSLGSSIPLTVLLTPRNKFQVTINEWSMHVNVAYRNLEARSRPRSICLCPFIDLLSHHATKEDPQRAVFVPDVQPQASSVLLAEKDFIVVFSEVSSNYDPVVTYFSEKCTEARGTEDKFRPTAVCLRSSPGRNCGGL